MNKKRTNLLVGFIIAFVFVIGVVSVFSLGILIKNGSPSLSDSSSVDTADLEIKSGNTDIEAKSGNNDDESKTHTNKEGSRRTANYSGPTISQVDQYIYNSDGKILKDFHDGERYYLDMTVNADASEAVLVYDNICYYIDADLNMTEIATDVNDAGICFDGGFCYYVEGEEGSGKEELFIYDIRNQTKVSLYTGNVVAVAISPNGRVAAISAYGGSEKICTVGINLEKQVYEADDRTSVVAVSNDASMIYFNQYGGSKDFFKCIDHGKEVTLSNEYLLESYFDKECEQMMYMDDEGLKYYKARNGEPVIITEDIEELRFDIAGGIKMPISFFSDYYILDTNCFSDVLMMHSFDDCYAFTGLVPEIVCLTSGNEDARNFSTAITDDGPTCIATSDESLVKFTYDGKKVKESTLCDVDHFGIEYVANKELDEIWFIMDNDVYYLSLSEGADPVMVADQGDKLNSTLIWDPFSQRCFFIKDDMYLCSVGTEAGDVVTICDYCHLLSSEGGKNHLIGFTSPDSNYYILIGDEIVEK